jgi:hypothetical protein
MSESVLVLNEERSSNDDIKIKPRSYFDEPNDGPNVSYHKIFLLINIGLTTALFIVMVFFNIAAGIPSIGKQKQKNDKKQKQ